MATAKPSSPFSSDAVKTLAFPRFTECFRTKNGFLSADIFVEGAGGDMEILNFGGKVSQEDYMCLQKYALGRLLFSLSGMRIVEPAEA